MPSGSAIIYRHFGDENAENIATALRQICFDKNIQLLIGHDPALAIKIGADGVHFRRDPDAALPLLWKRRCPDWIVTMAGLKTGALKTRGYRADISALDGLFISSIFKSQSPSSGEPIGPIRLGALCQELPCPVFALGGIDSDNAHELLGSGAAGLAAIKGLSKPRPSAEG